MIIEQLIKLGIPSYVTQIFTDIPTNAELNIQIAKQLPTQIGRIYGLSIYTDTVTPDNKPLITTTDAMNLYINLKHGATDFFENIRLDDMLSNFTGVPTLPSQKWLPVNIPGDFDLSTSSYINPTSIVSAAAPAAATVIALNLWYISQKAYNTLEDQGLVLENGMLSDKAKALLGKR